MKKNRHLLIAPDYPPPMVGGSLVYFFSLIENAEHDFDVLTAPLPEGSREISSPRHRMLRSVFLIGSTGPSGGRLFLMYLYLACRAALIGLTRSYDVIVIFTSAIGNGFFGLLFKLLRVKVVLIGIAEEIPLARRVPGLKGALKRFFLRGYRFADGFICNCDFVKDLIAGLGADERRMRVIPTPLNPRRKEAQPAPIERGGGSPRVLTIGRLVRRKGAHLLIEAVGRLKNEVPGIRLTIVGDGEEMPRLVKQAEEQGLSSQVTFTGTVKEEAELARLYGECDVFVLPNLFLEDGNCEGCPNVVIEASALGKPVIGGIEGGTTTAIRDGVTGFLVDPRDIARLADRIKQVLLDPALARRLGEAGREKVKMEHDPLTAGREFSRFISQVEAGDSVDLPGLA